MLLRLVLACCLLATIAQAQTCSSIKSCTSSVLKKGSKGSCVKILQQVLFSSSAEWDGDFGKKTNTAVILFQKANGRTADGIVGPKTWAKIVEKKGCGSSPPPSTGVTCKPTNRAVPSWNGGTKDQLACAVKSLAIKLGLPLRAQWAYIMATVEWETGRSFKPVREAPRATEAWRKRNFRYYPYYGRGYVQLTWERNYKTYGSLIGCNFVANPDWVMIPNISLYILVHGMAKGSFTGVGLSKYVKSGKTDFYNARRVINSLDRASEIRTMANAWVSKYRSLC